MHKDKHQDEAAKSRFFIIFQEEFKNIGKRLKKIFQFKKPGFTVETGGRGPKTLKPGGIEVTLMPAEAPLTSRMIYEKLSVLIIVMILAGVVVFIGWLWITWRCELELSKISQVKTEMMATESQVGRYQDLITEIRGLEIKANRVNDLLNHHIYWTRFFKLLETYTIPDVYYGDFSAEVGNKIVLPTFGRDLVAAARQLVAFSSALALSKKRPSPIWLAEPKA